MIPVSISLIGFLVALIIHVVWWRISLPGNTMKALFLLFLAGLIIVGAGTAALSESLSATLYSLGIFGAGSLCYLITYTAIDSDSPTLTLVAAMAERGEHGMTAADIEAFIKARPFVKSRFDQMVRDGLLRADKEGRYELSGTSMTALRLFDTYRVVVKRPTKGG